MKIILEDIGKKFRNNWIFRHINHSIDVSSAILGKNGSGKSTLVQIISGFMLPTEGKVTYIEDNDRILSSQNNRHSFSIAAPYLELLEEYTLREHLEFHIKFKPLLNKITVDNALALSGLQNSANKQIRAFSSGMKQRTRLLLAICSDTPVVLLDEPTSNLDSDSIKWYHELVQEFHNNRLFIVCSNHFEKDYPFCTHQIDLATDKIV